MHVTSCLVPFVQTERLKVTVVAEGSAVTLVTSFVAPDGTESAGSVTEIAVDGQYSQGIRDDNFPSGYGAVRLRSQSGSERFSAWASPDPDWAFCGVSGSALLSTDFRVPYLAHTQQVKLAITNPTSDAATVTVRQLGGFVCPPESVAAKNTWLWTGSQNDLGSGEGALRLSADGEIKVGAAVQRSGRWYYIYPLGA